MVSSVLVTGLMLLNYNAGLVKQFNFVILLATLTSLIPYAYSAAAGMLLALTDRERSRRRRQLVVDGLVAGLAFAYSVWTIAGSGYEVVYKGSLLLIAGIPVFVWLKYREPAQDTITPTVKRVA